MKAPSVTECYAMIRVLKKRAAKGDAEKIKQLEDLIDQSRQAAANLAIDRFFPK